MKKLIIFLLAVIFIISAYFYPQMPSMMVSHWNAAGEANGFMSRFLGLFLLPLMTLGIVLLFLIIPRIDPLRGNIEKFRKYYEGFIVVFILFMITMQGHTILWNIGVKISTNLFLPIGCGVLFFWIGILLRHTKRNWFIGIRTPWTLSSDNVWDRTHKVGGDLFQLVGVISLLGIFFQSFAIFFVVIPIMLTVIFITIYSYFMFKEEQAKKKK